MTTPPCIAHLVLLEALNKLGVHQGAVVMFRLLVQELLNNSFVEGWSTKNS
jgi:hypothetical protein